MNKDKPKICLVGCGQIGALHARNLAGKTDLLFHSRSWQSARVFQKKFLGRGIIADFEVVLESDVDAVVIATPPEYHADQIIAALQAGKAVLVEKPLCISAAEVARIENVLTQVENPLLMVAENYYYKPSLTYIKDLISAGRLGDLQSVFVKKLTTQTAEGWKSAHGALLEGGIHFVALIADLFDTSPVDVEAVFPGHREGEAERHSVTRLTFASQATAELHYSWDTPSLTKGVFQHSKIEGSGGTVIFESNGIYARHSGALLPAFPGLKDLMGYGAMTQDFLNCLQDRALQPYSNFERAKRDLDIVFRAYTDLG
ncbi:MAG: Gfo/Idh/MocA family oxidoreductase [Candidatus Latescibacteria bacterium]|nr:Gfo/Idh/MocA family oxidoreductase [Candidatus Latescibacterota bacterium]MBT4137336.1 Gfo/Idh/MocA family oxidoreductase [Candidatus Latescibacterota bacterium]MBT5831776.1 Gfo/Idh/MocA family oxidoreductase [Candidatus Latescibacterota bacterium]